MNTKKAYKAPITKVIKMEEGEVLLTTSGDQARSRVSFQLLEKDEGTDAYAD